MVLDESSLEASDNDKENIYHGKMITDEDQVMTPLE
jgi:hypothetical protein